MILASNLVFNANLTLGESKLPTHRSRITAVNLRVVVKDFPVDPKGQMPDKGRESIIAVNLRVVVKDFPVDPKGQMPDKGRESPVADANAKQMEFDLKWTDSPVSDANAKQMEFDLK